MPAPLSRSRIMVPPLTPSPRSGQRTSLRLARSLREKYFFAGGAGKKMI